jgi:fibronectin-binding autotransporter adhesin
MNSPRHPLSALLLCGLLLLIPNAPAQAGSATWNLNPISGNWNFAGNWTPATIPNSPIDIATLGVSNVTDIGAFTVPVEVNTVTFVAGASAFSINTGPQLFNLSGEGVVNDSGVMQNFVAPPFDEAGSFTFLWFTNNASAGSLTHYLVAGSDQELFSGAFMQFSNSASASFAAITVAGTGPSGDGSSGTLQFIDTSTADHATIVNATGPGGGGVTSFNTGSTAAESSITNEPGSSAIFGSGGMVVFNAGASGGNSVITNNGATVPGVPGGSTWFVTGSDMGTALVTANGGSNGGLGGSIVVAYTSTGAGGTIFAYGNGSLDISGHDAPGVTIGALNGDGVVFLGANTLTIGGNDARSVFAGVIQDSGLPQDSSGGVTKIGSNVFILSGENRYTGTTTVLEGKLSVNSAQGSGTGTGPVPVRNGILAGNGVIQDFDSRGGSLAKIGLGTLTLTGANTYRGRTTVGGGTLVVENKTGSATGTGTLNVNAGTLGGGGTIGGAATIGTGRGAGASLAPAFGSKKQVTLTLKSSLTLQADATYTYTFKARGSEARTDLLIANGVTINGAKIKLKGKTHATLTPGSVLTVISNTSANPISGTFSNLVDGAIVTVNGNTFQANYEGGDGNDLVLTVIP